jgi:hypothetical protein
MDQLIPPKAPFGLTRNFFGLGKGDRRIVTCPLQASPAKANSSVAENSRTIGRIVN